MSSFTWQRVRTRFGGTVSFVSDAFDQHAVSWCGCCFVVAVVQCIEDRGHILMRKRTPLDMQGMLNHVSHAFGKNACRGGLPEDVLKCIIHGSCPLMRRRGCWTGRPQPVTHTQSSNVPFVVTGIDKAIYSHMVKDILRKDGPVILMINSDTLKAVDGKGVVTDLTYKVMNHAVTVVGWTEDDMWIVRNSWGRMRVPTALPDNLECVDDDNIECKVSWEYWIGDPNNPGFLFLPMTAEALQPPNAPWIVPLLARK